LRLEADADMNAPAEPMWARVARLAAGWGPGGTVGLVVGATAPDELAAIRVIAPGLPFLVPGVGEQGGDVGVVLRHGPVDVAGGGAQSGPRLLVNVSRAIAGAAVAAAVGTDLGEALARAARGWANRLPVLP
jgi:orotidine-5'-phosphate decarboxylase